MVVLISVITIISCDTKNNDVTAPGSKTDGAEQGNINENGNNKNEDTPKENEIDNSETEIGVLTQEYIGENIAEILWINYDGSQFEETNYKNPEIEQLDLTIKTELLYMYNDFMNDPGEYWIEMKSYPFTTGEWLQIVTTYIIYPTYGTDGTIVSYNFNKKQNRYVTVEDAMSEAGLTNAIITDKVKELYMPDYPSKYISDVKTKGFRILEDENGQFTMFLLEVTEDNPDAGEWTNFYAYIPKPKYDLFYSLSSYCLFDPYDMDEMVSPLFYTKTINDEYGRGD